MAEVTSGVLAARHGSKTQVASRHQSRFCQRAGTTAEPSKPAWLGLRHGSCLCRPRLMFCSSVSGRYLCFLNPHIHFFGPKHDSSGSLSPPKFDSSAVRPMSFAYRCGSSRPAGDPQFLVRSFMLRMTTISVQYCFNTARERKCIFSDHPIPLMRIYRQGSTSCEVKPENLLLASRHVGSDSDWVSLLRQVSKVPVNFYSKGRGLQLRFTPSTVDLLFSLRTATPGPLLQYISGRAT